MASPLLAGISSSGVIFSCLVMAADISCFVLWRISREMLESAILGVISTLFRITVMQTRPRRVGSDTISVQSGSVT